MDSKNNLPYLELLKIIYIFVAQMNLVGLMKQVRRILFPYFLISLFTMYQVNLLVFTHVHYINGVIITHSHPSQGEHTHSNAECIYFNHLSTFLSLEPSVTFTFDQQVFDCWLLGERRVASWIKEVCLQIPSLRAPPFLV